MSVIRKFALVLLVVALAPAMVLAAMPLKYCKAAVTEHHALEFIIDGVSHGGDHDSHHDGDAVRAAHFDGCGAASLIEPETCTDTALTQLAPSPQTELQFVALPALFKLVFPVVDTISTAPAAVDWSSFTDRLRPDPRLSAHRVMVLRI